MSLIQYQPATYAGHLREQLELAGCESRVAAIVARTVGELIDHVSRTESDIRRDMARSPIEASFRDSNMRAARRDLIDRAIGVSVFVMAVVVTGAVMLAFLP